MSSAYLQVYIAGPMRGYPEFNFPAFFEAEAELLEAECWSVANPARHDIDQGFAWEGTTGYEDLNSLGFNFRAALTWDLEQVLKSEYILLLPGWEKSEGAMLEYRTAKMAGIKHLLWRDALDPADLDKPVTVAKASGEVRITSATGGQKGQKPAQLGTVDPIALYELAKVAGMGAEKYEAFNYLKGYDWRLSYDAMQRHSMEFWMGNDMDDESGLCHMAHAAWHALAMVSFLYRNVGDDTRPSFI